MPLLFLKNIFSEATLRAAGWMLFHSLWIGLLAAALAGAIIIATRRSSARLRYNLLTGVMFLFLAACALAFIIQKNSPAVAVGAWQQTDTASVTSLASQNRPSIAISKDIIGQFSSYFNANADLFVLIWAVFFLLHSIKLVTGVAGIHRLRHYRTCATTEEWKARLEDLSARAGIRQSVLLLQSELVKVPVAIGFFKPVILVPLGLLSNLPPAQVETILLHELAHIRRGDYLMNILQRVAEAIFFFNPAFTWLCSLIRQEREACCDDIVVAITGQEVNYLEALVSFQEYAASSHYAMAIKTKQQHLLNRVKRILTRENKKLDLMGKLLLLTALVVFTAFTFIPQHQKKKYEPAGILIPVAAPGFTAEQREKPVDVAVNKNVVVKKTPAPLTAKDTIPEKEVQPLININNISTSTNDDGKTKNQTIIAVDQNGTKYIITKVNDKMTLFQAGDRVIPGNEIDRYASVFRQIEEAEAKNRARKQKKLEDITMLYEKKKAHSESNKDAYAEEKTSKAEIEKKLERKKAELVSEIKMIEQKKQELIAEKKELEQDKKELKTKEAKEKEQRVKELKNREAMIELRGKEIEQKKQGIDIKKKDIKNDQKMLELEKLKEKQLQLRKELSVTDKAADPAMAMNSNSATQSSFEYAEINNTVHDFTYREVHVAEKSESKVPAPLKKKLFEGKHVKLFDKKVEMKSVPSALLKPEPEKPQ